MFEDGPRGSHGPTGTAPVTAPGGTCADLAEAAGSGTFGALTVATVTAMRQQLRLLDPVQPADPRIGRTTAGTTSPTAATARGTAQSCASAPVATTADPHRGGHGLTQAQCIDMLRELEDLKAAAAGAQAAVTAHLVRARHDAEEAAGAPAAERGKGLVGEVALARRVSPHQGGRHLGLAQALDADMPHTLAALRRGVLSEWRATLLVRESICLSAPDRHTFDEQMCGDPGRLNGWGDKRLIAEAKKIAYRLDPHSVAARSARAEKERCVSIRPAPDTMAYLTALLPVGKAVAAHAALIAAAGAARVAGDDRSRGQVMADTLVSRLTGRDTDIPADVEIKLVMTDRTLLAGGTEPAHLPGYGTVPPSWARDLTRRALDSDGVTGLWLRRLFTDQGDHLVATDSRRRHAPPGLADYVATRDAGTCRTPWCDAPIRHIDHVIEHQTGGPTSADNLQGLCEQCNYTKASRGWSAAPAGPGSRPPGTARAGPAARAGPTIETRTPTGHTYHSPTPRLPRAG